jgi:hypothetical protein
MAFGSAICSCTRTASRLDPTAFLTAIPSWKADDEFLAGSHLQKFLAKRFKCSFVTVRSDPAATASD